MGTADDDAGPKRKNTEIIEFKKLENLVKFELKSPVKKQLEEKAYLFRPPETKKIEDYLEAQQQKTSYTVI